MADPSNELLTAEELVAELKIPIQRLYDWRNRGNGKDHGPESIKIGTELRFRRSDVEAWLEGRREGSQGVGAQNPVTRRRSA